MRGLSPRITVAPAFSSTEPATTATSAGTPLSIDTACQVVSTPRSPSRVRRNTSVRSSAHSGSVSSPASPDRLVPHPRPCRTPRCQTRSRGDAHERNPCGVRRPDRQEHPIRKVHAVELSSATGTASTMSMSSPVATRSGRSPVHSFPRCVTRTGRPDAPELTMTPREPRTVWPRKSRARRHSVSPRSRRRRPAPQPTAIRLEPSSPEPNRARDRLPSQQVPLQVWRAGGPDHPS